MIDLSQYQGIAQFGRAYRIMLGNDAHAPGSVDRVLVERMVRLCRDTAAHLYEQFTPAEARYQAGSRPKLEDHLKHAGADRGGEEQKIEGICRFCASVAARGTDDLDKIRFGGTEEELISRGTDFCNELARVACAMCQVGGLPARMVMLADMERAYCGHVIVEVYRSGVWGAADPTTDVIYRHADARPATTWELMNRPDLVQRHWRDDSTPYTTPGTFRAAAISKYSLCDRGSYDYAISPINDYYRSILEMAGRGWPGGLRWLHGEDAA